MEQEELRRTSEMWGRAYEILVKRGVLACLIERGLLPHDHPSLARWHQHTLFDVSISLANALDVVDPTAKKVLSNAFKHHAPTAFGTGYTVTRTYLNDVIFKGLRHEPTLKAIWTPLSLPHEDSIDGAARDAQLMEFKDAMGLEAPADPYWLRQGQPGNADFILWVTDGNGQHQILVQEYSYALRGEIGDFTDQRAHLDEVQDHVALIGARSVFTRVTPEVSHERFEIASDIEQYFGAITAKDKPFYKLCQASSYGSTLIQLLTARKMISGRSTVRAMAVTPVGIESLNAQHGDPDNPDPRIDLMARMGEAYQNVDRRSGKDPAKMVTQLFHGMVAKLPTELRRRLKQLGDLPDAGEDFFFEFDEQVRDFHNPNETFPVEEAIEMIDTGGHFDQYFRQPVREAIGSVMRQKARAGRITLRNIHAASIVAALRALRPGEMRVVALEGNPGIGKTTAVREYLSDLARNEGDAGYLMLYTSPRVVINRDLSLGMARRRKLGGEHDELESSGIMTITTNSTFSAAVRQMFEQRGIGRDQPRRKIEAGVLVDGVEGFVKPTDSSIHFVLANEEEHIESGRAGATIKGLSISEDQMVIRDRASLGVLRTLALATKQALAVNPSLNKVAITCAIQGMKQVTSTRTTIDALSNLFQFDIEKQPQAAKAEREKFAQRMPTILVMIDELAGDGAGPAFVHGVARFLREQFVRPWENDPKGSPFKVALVIADASLVNETVLDRFLNAGDRAPDKVLISKSRGPRPYEIGLDHIKIGGPKAQVFHVMTNSYPASGLNLDLRVRMKCVVPQEVRNKPGVMETARDAMRRAAGEQTIDSMLLEIERALRDGCQQTICFVQNKAMLGELCSAVLKMGEFGLRDEQIALLHTNVSPQEKKRLLSEESKRELRLILMTSSGSRGISFPRCDRIIASMPRFGIESALMEISQLIYRGRGSYRERDGTEVFCDALDRRLVMVIDDFITPEAQQDPRQWLRHAVDLLTLMVMLRATIFTRIKGDSGLSQPISFVPVGAVATEERSTTVAEEVFQFIKEARLLVSTNLAKNRIKEAAAANPEELAEGPDGLLLNAVKNAEQLFASTHIGEMINRDNARSSLITKERMGRFIADSSNMLGTLIGDFKKHEDAREYSLPDGVFICGPIVQEQWTGSTRAERFDFTDHSMDPIRMQLSRQLGQIDSDHSIAHGLRAKAKNLKQVIDREGWQGEDAARTSEGGYMASKEIKSADTWVAFPSDYLRFLAEPLVDETKEFHLQDGEDWKSALCAMLGCDMGAAPPIPSYQSIPWIMSIGQYSPMRMNLVFDDRYFMTSNEINLLNMLMLARPADQR